MSEDYGLGNLKPVSVEDLKSKVPPEMQSIINQAQQSQQAAQQQRPQVAPQVQQVATKDLSQHPVLRKLKERMGIKPQKVYDYEFEFPDGGTMLFGMTEYPETINAWCMLTANKMSAINGEPETFMVYYEALRVGASIVAIDNTPAYEVFQINVTNEDYAYVGQNPYHLSDRLRKEVAISFCNLSLNELNHATEKLADFFDTKITRKGEIAGAEYVRGELFICPVEGCSFMHRGFQVKGPAGDLQPFYCVNHGQPMVSAIKPKDEANVPLG